MTCAPRHSQQSWRRARSVHRNHPDHETENETMDTLHELAFNELNEVTGGASAPPPPTKQGHVFEIEDYSFDIEQVLNIGSQ